jgi:hypothetical protein
MIKTLRTIGIIAFIYLAAAFSYADIAWFIKNGMIENLLWVLAAVWLAGVPFAFLDD